jgi:TPR repeat protein
MAIRLPQYLILTSIVFLIFVAAFADEMSDGLAAYKAGHYEEAYKLWRPLAEKGDANAQYNLGLLYRNGRGVEQNDREALIWFSKAAQQGMLDAQYNTGLMYMEGRGVAVSKLEAFEWWKLAASKGHAPSQHNLAVLYAYGIATRKNVNKAIELWTMSANQGYKGARKALYKIYSEGLFGIKPDPVQAKKWQD